ncbi:MAG: HEPN domain-containing protein [Oligoflexia bacterium]|nr:HEPN domain-containing protein [Oligoflexia bacterium]
MIKKAKLVEYWKENSIEDLAAAKDIAIKASRNIHALFFLHLAIEKVLKALFVHINGTQAPLIHNLLLLANKSNLTLSDEDTNLLLELNEFNLGCRYPDDIQEIKKIASNEFTKHYLDKVEVFHKWILEKLN